MEIKHTGTHHGRARHAAWLVAAMLLAALALPTPALAAQDAGWYMVEGLIYVEGYEGYMAGGGPLAEIRRIQLVDEIPAIESGGGEDYALYALDTYGHAVDSINLGVSFAPAADGGGQALAYAVFTALLPYDESIAGFQIYDAGGALLAQAELDSVLGEIVRFEVEDTGEGYQCNWELEYTGDASAWDIRFDVVAVSAQTGETNMLAYQITDYEVMLPYEYLEPNDTITFRLLCYDGATRLTAESIAFDTPNGEDDTVIHNDPWYEIEEDVVEEEEGGILWMVLAVLMVLVPVALAVVGVLAIVRVVKKKKGER